MVLSSSDKGKAVGGEGSGRIRVQFGKCMCEASIRSPSGDVQKAVEGMGLEFWRERTLETSIWGSLAYR